MSRTGRNSLLLLIVSVLIVTTSLATLGAEEGGEADNEGGETTSTTESGLSPAVPLEDEEAAPAEIDWTYRYMIPTGLIIAAVIILITSIKYFTDVVRRRYRIVDQ